LRMAVFEVLEPGLDLCVNLRRAGDHIMLLCWRKMGDISISQVIY